MVVVGETAPEEVKFFCRGMMRCREEVPRVLSRILKSGAAEKNECGVQSGAPQLGLSMQIRPCPAKMRVLLIAFFFGSGTHIRYKDNVI